MQWNHIVGLDVLSAGHMGLWIAMLAGNIGADSDSGALGGLAKGTVSAACTPPGSPICLHDAAERLSLQGIFDGSSMKVLPVAKGNSGRAAATRTRIVCAERQQLQSNMAHIWLLLMFGAATADSDDDSFDRRDGSPTEAVYDSLRNSRSSARLVGSTLPECNGFGILQVDAMASLIVLSYAHERAPPESWSALCDYLIQSQVINEHDLGNIAPAVHRQSSGMVNVESFQDSELRKKRHNPWSHTAVFDLLQQLPKLMQELPVLSSNYDVFVKDNDLKSAVQATPVRPWEQDAASILPGKLVCVEQGVCASADKRNICGVGQWISGSSVFKFDSAWGVPDPSSPGLGRSRLCISLSRIFQELVQCQAYLQPCTTKLDSSKIDRDTPTVQELVVAVKEIVTFRAGSQLAFAMGSAVGAVQAHGKGFTQTEWWQHEAGRESADSLSHGGGSRKRGGSQPNMKNIQEIIADSWPASCISQVSPTFLKFVKRMWHHTLVHHLVSTDVQQIATEDSGGVLKFTVNQYPRLKGESSNCASGSVQEKFLVTGPPENPGQPPAQGRSWQDVVHLLGVVVTLKSATGYTTGVGEWSKHASVQPGTKQRATVCTYTPEWWADFEKKWGYDVGSMKKAKEWILNVSPSLSAQGGVDGPGAKSSAKKRKVDVAGEGPGPPAADLKDADGHWLNLWNTEAAGSILTNMPSAIYDSALPLEQTLNMLATLPKNDKPDALLQIFMGTSRFTTLCPVGPVTGVRCIRRGNAGKVEVVFTSKLPDAGTSQDWIVPLLELLTNLDCPCPADSSVMLPMYRFRVNFVMMVAQLLGGRCRPPGDLFVGLPQAADAPGSPQPEQAVEPLRPVFPYRFQWPISEALQVLVETFPGHWASWPVNAPPSDPEAQVLRLAQDLQTLALNQHLAVPLHLLHNWVAVDPEDLMTVHFNQAMARDGQMVHDVCKKIQATGDQQCLHKIMQNSLALGQKDQEDVSAMLASPEWQAKILAVYRDSRQKVLALSKTLAPPHSFPTPPIQCVHGW